MQRSQRRAVGREGVQHVQQCPEMAGLSQRTGALHLLLRPRQIDFGCVLRQDHHRLSRDAPPSRLLMRLQNVGEGHILVVEQPVRSLHFGPASAGRRNTCRRVRRQLREHLAQTLVQPFVLEINRLHFVHNPRRKHRHSFDSLRPPPLIHRPAIIARARLNHQSQCQNVWNNEALTPGTKRPCFICLSGPFTGLLGNSPPWAISHSACGERYEADLRWLESLQAVIFLFRLNRCTGQRGGDDCNTPQLQGELLRQSCC